MQRTAHKDWTRWRSSSKRSILLLFIYKPWVLTCSRNPVYPSTLLLALPCIRVWVGLGVWVCIYPETTTDPKFPNVTLQQCAPWKWSQVDISAKEQSAHYLFPIPLLSHLHISVHLLQFTDSCSATLSLPRVINFKFSLQPHQKYNIVQYEELGFSKIEAHMKDDHITNSHHLTFWTWKWKGKYFTGKDSVLACATLMMTNFQLSFCKIMSWSTLSILTWRASTSFSTLNPTHFTLFMV